MTDSHLIRSCLAALGLALGLIGTPSAQTPTPAAPPAGSPQAEAGEPRARLGSDAEAPSKPAEHLPAKGVDAKPAARPAASAGQKPGAKSDRVDLDLATVTGDHEQPKVLYIVPWKRADIGDLQGKPMHSLVDEILSPVDRDVFRRQVFYYQALEGQDAPKAPPKGEK